MTITIKSNPDGVSGAIQVNGVNKVTIGASGITAGSFAPNSIDAAAAALAFSGANQSLAASGYQKLPSGLIIQWGKASIVGVGGSNFAFPIVFPTACRSLVGVIDDISVSTEFCTAYNASNSTGAFRLNTANTRTVDWVAIGY